MKHPKIGSVYKDEALDPPWNLLLVSSISPSGGRIKLKRPHTHPGKTFVLFEDLTMVLPFPDTFTLIRE